LRHQRHCGTTGIHLQKEDIMRRLLIALSLAVAMATAAAQNGPMTAPGAPDVKRVRAGTYKADKDHSQVAWTVNHFGISQFHGLFGEITGSLTLDPTRISAAKVYVEIPITKMVTTNTALVQHMFGADFFDVAKYPTATFTSTRVVANGANATITGNLTLHGVTRPVVLRASFTGAGDHPMNKALNIGFEASTSIKRSDFGMGKFVPMVGDQIDLQITAAFEKTG
jgi:polyisoprenoid-binding protein YceI